MFVALGLAALALTACGPSLGADVTADQAAAAINRERAFTTRAGSDVGRELVKVVAIRRIGRSSCEVEFTWKNTAPKPGLTTTPVKTSMGLFRRQDDGHWALTSLYKVD